jgi:adenylate cyclase
MAAAAIMNNLPQLNKKLVQNGLPEICSGAGIATGEVISGRIGSHENRLDYTVIGDRVNLAARLESMSHFSATGSILSDAETMNEAKDSCSFRPHGSINIKGKSQPVETYELV